MSTWPRLRLLKRARPMRWTTLAWCVAIAAPLISFVTVQHGLRGHANLWVPLAVVLTVLPAALLRRWPLVALPLMMAISLIATIVLSSREIGYLPIVAGDLAVGFIAATHRRRISIIAAAIALAAQVASAAYGSRDDVLSRPIPSLVVLVVTAWLIGNSIRERRAYAESLRAQAAAQAATAERLRIARELHDLVVHSIAIIAIQAGVGSRVMDTQPAEARNALDTIEATSRETLAGLRRTLATLRRTEAGPAPRDPAPGLADIDRLAASTMDAGVRVDVRWLGTRRPVPADIELSAFRIVQEALTNVVRHAGTGDCRVTVDYRSAELCIEIVDDGRGGVVTGVGYGIVGMRERAGLLHGHLTAEPRPEGGFRVAAQLPVPAAVR